MGAGQFSVAAATAVLGYDLTTGQTWAVSGENRELTGFGLMGSAAAGDTKVQVFIDQVMVWEGFNISTGFPNNDSLIDLDNLNCPAGSKISIIVTDAPSTNPINGLLTWE